jgi:hypothetical protein
MAILIPDVPKQCSVSERLVCERLGRELPDDWVLLHSLGLPGHETKIWGEADIVVISADGVFALEVKGGSVSCRDGTWHFESPGREGYTKKESPWAQAMGTMVAIRAKLREADQVFKDTLFGFGVVMPMTTFTTTGAEIISDVLLDRRNFNEKLGPYVGRLKRYWSTAYREKHGKSFKALTLTQIRLARQVLRPDLETTLSVGGWLTGIEQRLLHLTNEQVRASRRMAANPRTIVRGQAGTGKTVIALERARQLSEQGARVLYLCFNQLLAEHVRAGLAGDRRAQNVDVWHAHSLYRDIIDKAGLIERLAAADASDPAFFAQVFPALAADALCTGEVKPYDAFVVDEAQDLLTAAHLDVFDLLLREGLERGRWHLFLDPRQNIYGAEEQEAADERLKTAYPAFEDLFENCRNTRQVAVQASIISGVDLAIAGAPDGLPCDNVYYTSQEDLIDRLSTLVSELLARDVRPGHVAILSTRKRENSLLRDVPQIAGRRIADVADQAALKAGAILFSTMHAFKGLERPVVIAIDMDEIGQPAWQMLHYAGLSRACGLLRTFIPARRRRAYEKQAEAFGRRLQTEMMEENY